MRPLEFYQPSFFPRKAICFLAATLAATQIRAGDLFDMSLDELLNVKITSATLTPKSLQSAPASVSLFTSEEIDKLGVNTLEELLNYAPGYQSAKRGDGSQQSPYSARGRAIGTSSTEVIVLLDGRRIDNSISGGQSTMLPQLSLANIATVEFLRGPASSLYGSNAFLGVVNLTSRYDRNRIKVSAASHGTASVQANFAQSNEQGLHLSLFAQKERSDGETFQVFDKFTNQIVPAEAPYENLDIDLRLSISQTELSFFHAQRSNQGYFVLGNISPEINASRNHVTLLSFKQKLPSDIFESLTLAGGIRRRTLNITAQTTPVGAFSAISSPPSDEPAIIKANIGEIEPWLKLDGHYESSSSYQLLFGLDCRTSSISDNELASNYDLSGLSRSQYPISYYEGEFRPNADDSSSDEDIFGAYLEFENQFDSGAALTLGLRYDTFSSANSHLSPRITYVLPFQNNAFLKLICGQAYRAPNLSERTESPNNVQVGNPSLKPETVTTTEAIIGANWAYAYTSLSLFENTFQDSIVQGIVGDIRTFVNADNESSRGVEAETIFEIDDRWSMRASATHFLTLPDSSFRDSRTLASISLNRSSQNWNANLSAIYHSEQDTPTADPAKRETLPEYSVLNAKLRLRVAEGSTLSLSIANLLDKSYQTGSQSFIPGGVPNPRRALTIDYQFEW